MNSLRWLCFGLGLATAACSANGMQFGNDAGNGNDTTSPTDTGTHDGTSPGTDVALPLCGMTPTSVSGTVYAPNGTDPLPNVLVYVLPDSATLPAAPTMVQCQTCSNPPAALAWGESSANGTFSVANDQLDMGGMYTVVFSSGGFRHVERHVVFGMCQQLTLPGTQTRMPGANSGEDTIPSILVAGSHTSSADVNDQFSNVLDAIGITGYTLVDPDKSGTNGGSGTDLLTVISNMSMLSQYQMVIAPCGSLGDFSVLSHITPQIAANLTAWLGLGGRLYASDLAYGIVQQAYPGAITFANGTPPHAGDDPADIGVGLVPSTSSIDATVNDMQLLTWLQSVGVVASGATTIPVTQLRDPWGAVGSVPDAELTGSMGPSGDILVSANVMWHDGTSGVHPLTVLVDYEGSAGICGRVVFTSYHVESGTTGMPLTPQERVLEYLFFRLSTCIAAPG